MSSDLDSLKPNRKYTIMSFGEQRIQLPVGHTTKIVPVINEIKFEKLFRYPDEGFEGCSTIIYNVQSKNQKLAHTMTPYDGLVIWKSHLLYFLKQRDPEGLQMIFTHGTSGDKYKTVKEAFVKLPVIDRSESFDWEKRSQFVMDVKKKFKKLPSAKRLEERFKFFML